MGLYYGLCFGIFDLEDKRGFKLDLYLIKEEFYCMPIAGTLGFLGGIINELFRIKSEYNPFTFSRVDQDPFSSEIDSQ